MWILSVVGKMARVEGVITRQDFSTHQSIENLQRSLEGFEDFSFRATELFNSYGLSFTTRHKILKEEYEVLEQWLR